MKDHIEPVPVQCISVSDTQWAEVRRSFEFALKQIQATGEIPDYDYRSVAIIGTLQGLLLNLAKVQEFAIAKDISETIDAICLRRIEE